VRSTPIAAGHRHGADARVLRGGSVPARVRSWPYAPEVAQLVVYRSPNTPTEHDVRAWLSQLGVGVALVRTGALGVASATAFRAAGFHEVQRLVLLQHRAPAAAATSAPGGTRRMRSSELTACAAVDGTAFSAPWSLDAASLDDACRATARHRARVVRERGNVAGFAISGREGPDGYLQRLAVAPQNQGRGLGSRLVLDGLRWCAEQGAHRVLVNTHVDNLRALTLYRRLGFEDLDEQLVVLERAVP
jgi:[ribosomal protein S18]-alanine N-acetyltransferase